MSWWLRANRRRARGARVRLWTGDATRIPAPDATYDAVFDFGIIHHVPQWRRALAEVARVLRPGGRVYAEEVLRGARFDQADFFQALGNVGLHLVASQGIGGAFGWFVADRPAAA